MMSLILDLRCAKAGISGGYFRKEQSEHLTKDVVFSVFVVGGIQFFPLTLKHSFSVWNDFSQTTKRCIDGHIFASGEESIAQETATHFQCLPIEQGQNKGKQNILMK